MKILIAWLLTMVIALIVGYSAGYSHAYVNVWMDCNTSIETHTKIANGVYTCEFTGKYEDD